MLGSIRRLAYKMGFRPAPATILFSPTLDLKYSYKEAMENFSWNKVFIFNREVVANMNACEVCGKTDDKKPLCFRNTAWCSENHRKEIQGDNPVERY